MYFCPVTHWVTDILMKVLLSQKQLRQIEEMEEMEERRHERQLELMDNQRYGDGMSEEERIREQIMSLEFNPNDVNDIISSLWHVTER